MAISEDIALAPLVKNEIVDEGLPAFPPGIDRKTYPITGPDGRLKTRDEIWLSGVLIYVREYDQATYGDPA